MMCPLCENKGDGLCSEHETELLARRFGVPYTYQVDGCRDYGVNQERLGELVHIGMIAAQEAVTKKLLEPVEKTYPNFINMEVK